MEQYLDIIKDREISQIMDVIVSESTTLEFDSSIMMEEGFLTAYLILGDGERLEWECEDYEGVCYMDDAELDGVTVMTQMDASKGLFKQMVRIGELDLEIYTEMDFYARQPTWT